MTENSFKINVEEAIVKLLTADEFENISVKIEDSTEKNRILATVKATKAGSSKDLNLVVQLGKNEHALEGYKREAYVLREVVPLFQDVQKYLKIQNPLMVFPKCYNTLNQDGNGIILLENLEKTGYSKAQGDLNEHNYKLVLQTIAKFHGLSLALRHLHHDKFDKVLGNCRIISKTILEDLAQFFNSRLEKLKFNLKLRMRLDLLKKFEEALENFGGEKIIQILNEKVENSVLVHGDYHHNSVLLKYQGENATDVVLEGFQVSGLHSPVIDLSNYYFSSIDRQYFSGVSDFLKYYYEELSSFLTTLGCNAEDIFSFNTLLDHWQRYSFYGFCFAIASLESGSLKLEDLLAEFKKEYKDGEVSISLTRDQSRAASNGTYRRKLEKIVEGFLDSEAES